MGNFWEAVEHTKFISHIASSNPVYGTLTAMHYFTLFVLTGTAVIFDMHLFGWVAKDTTSTQFAEEIFPWTWAALAFALFSGFALWLTDAGDYYRSPVMNTKIILVLIAIVWTILIRRSVRRWDEAPKMPATAKVMALVSIALWLACIMEGNNIAALCGLG
jgi:hypothetical protein